MRIQLLRGTTAQNNGLTLTEGELSVDLEAKALRLHDGTTLGGFELPGTRAIEPPTFGDFTAGFYGEIPAAEFITGSALASAVGLSAGTLQHDTTPWLKFALEGKILYIPQKTIRYSLSWEHIYQAGVVYGVDGFGVTPSGGDVDQGTVVTVGGKDYRVRLLRGAASDPTTDSTGYDIVESHGSEWNRLMYPIHSGVHTTAGNPTTHTDPSAEPYGTWAQYSDDDLLVDNPFGTGVYSWCQETTATTTNRIGRGASGITRTGSPTATNNHTLRGWRPVLELVE